MFIPFKVSEFVDTSVWLCQLTTVYPSPPPPRKCQSFQPVPKYFRIGSLKEKHISRFKIHLSGAINHKISREAVDVCCELYIPFAVELSVCILYNFLESSLMIFLDSFLMIFLKNPSSVYLKTNLKITVKTICNNIQYT